jgi:hypothetical protein
VNREGRGESVVDSGERGDERRDFRAERRGETYTRVTAV